MGELRLREFLGGAVVWGESAIQVCEDSGGFHFFPVGGTTNNAADGQWHHVSLVRRGTAFRTHLDSVQIGSKSTNFVTHLSNSTVFKIGTAPCIGFSLLEQRYHGLLDEIKFYSWALTASQIAETTGISDPNRPTLNITALPGAVRFDVDNERHGLPARNQQCADAPCGLGRAHVQSQRPRHQLRRHQHPWPRDKILSPTQAVTQLGEAIQADAPLSAQAMPRARVCVTGKTASHRQRRSSPRSSFR